MAFGELWAHPRAVSPSIYNRVSFGKMNMMKKNLFSYLLIVVCLCVFGGCSRENRPKDLPKLTPATLTLTQDGKPLEKAIVFLYAENPDIAKWTVSGNTDANGETILVTHGQFRGAPAGKFKVCVTKVEDAGNAGEPDPNAGLATAGFSTPSGRPRLIYHVDPVYGDPQKTPLEVEVPAKGKGIFTLDVGKPN